MATFTATPHRQDPYKGFKFRVVWDGRPVAGVTGVSGLRRTTEVVEYREGGDASTVHKIPGRTKYDPITLERGVTQDLEFENWANQVRSVSADAATSLQDFRRDVLIELYNERGTLAVRWKVFRCWVSAFAAIAELDASGSAIAIERLTLENEGWERDLGVPAPPET